MNGHCPWITFFRKFCSKIAGAQVSQQYCNDDHALIDSFATKCKKSNVWNCLIFIYNQPEIFMAIESFPRIEKFRITIFEKRVKYSLIESLVSNLRVLRHLYVGVYLEIIDWEFVSMVILKCPSLEKFTISIELMGHELEVFSIVT